MPSTIILCVILSPSLTIAISIAFDYSIYTSGAYVAIRQQDVLQETLRESKPCLAVKDEALKKGLRRAQEGLKKALRT